MSQHDPPSHSLGKGESGGLRKLSLVLSTSKIGRQLPQGQPLPSQPEALPAAGASSRGVCLLLLHPPYCKLLLPRHDRCGCYSVFSSQDKSLCRSTKPTGMFTGPTPIETTCRGPSPPRPQHTGMCAHTYKHLFQISRTCVDPELAVFFSESLDGSPKMGTALPFLKQYSMGC